MKVYIDELQSHTHTIKDTRFHSLLKKKQYLPGRIISHNNLN